MTKHEEDARWNAKQMRLALLEASEQYPWLPGLVYRSPYDFVAEHGEVYLPCPFDGKLGVQRMCFGNAIVEAGVHGYRYVEGFAATPAGQVIHHAWNVRQDGRLHDVTWANTGGAYIGVEFSVERADDATWNGNASVLLDESRGYPVYRQYWTGEDYTLVWPPSDRLDMLRGAQRGVPASVTSFLEKL